MLPLATTDPSVRVLLFSPGCHIVGILPDASLQDCFFTPVWFPYSFSCQGGSCLFIAWNNTPLSAHFIVYLVTDLRASGCLQVLRITNQGVTIFCFICVIITFHLVWGPTRGCDSRMMWLEQRDCFSLWDTETGFQCGCTILRSH